MKNTNPNGLTTMLYCNLPTIHLHKQLTNQKQRKASSHPYNRGSQLVTRSKTDEVNWSQKIDCDELTATRLFDFPNKGFWCEFYGLDALPGVNQQKHFGFHIFCIH